MSYTIVAAAYEFQQLASRISKVWPNHLSAGNTFRSQLGWPAPALRTEDAADLANDIADRIFLIAGEDDPSSIEVDEHIEMLATQAAQIDLANIASDPMSVVRSTFEFLLFANSKLQPKKIDVNWEKADEKQLLPKNLAARLRSMEASITSLQPRLDGLEGKAKAVEQAYDAAERLPTTLKDLSEAEAQVKAIQKSCGENQIFVDIALKDVRAKQSEIERLEIDAKRLVALCENAYRIATSTGLAGAFEHRANGLKQSVLWWTGLLVLSLGVAVLVGQQRFESIKALLEGSHSWAVILLNIVFVVIGVGAPIWMAWLSTHQIGRASRLSEDYAFKSAVAKAYEGFRKEAVSLDPDFAKRLFGSALDRLDELPSRLVAKGQDNSPLEALLKNEQFAQLLSKFPEQGNEIRNFLVKFRSGTFGGGGLANGVAKATQKQDDGNTSAD